MKLNVGCGKEPNLKVYPISEWINVDLYVDNPQVLKHDVCNLPADWTNKFDEVYCGAVLEHISWRKGGLALREMFRVLKPEGKFTVIVPDLDWTCGMFAALKDGTPQKDWMLMVLYGLQDHEGEYHKTGYTVVNLQRCLEETGFVAIQIDPCWNYGSKCLISQAMKGGIA